MPEFTLTYEEITRTRPFFEKLAACDSLPSAIKLRIIRIKRSFDEHVKDLNMLREELKKKYGKPNEKNPEQYDLPNDTEVLATANLELQNAAKESVQIPGAKIPFEAVSQVSFIVNGFHENGMPMHSRAQLSVNDLLQLEWLIDFPDDAKAELPAEVAAKAAA